MPLFPNVIIRTGLVVGAIAAVVTLLSKESPNPAKPDLTWLIDELEPGTNAYNVQSYFRSRSHAIDVPGWPRTVGEVEGFERGMPYSQKWGEPFSSYRIPPDRELDWVINEMPDDHKWLAVAYAWMGGSMSVIVTHRTGKATPTPNEIRAALRRLR